MGKRIIQQRRGKGGHTYKTRPKAGKLRVGYMGDLDGEFECVKFIPSIGHSVPIARFRNKEGKSFDNFSVDLLYIGQKISFGGSKTGDIAKLGELKNGTEIFNIEHNPKDGGKFVRTGGNAGVVMAREGDIVKVMMPSKRIKKFAINCRATIGRAAGGGRIDKPVLKAGKKFYIMKMKSKLWPRVSAVKMNAIDHPFGSGRGKRIKSKIAKRNASPAKKVGLIRPRRTGRKKR
ncbi:50S ribosomal protein L2 [Candidatus Peregrinibacteria bacterium]|nr:50S ribosomal protein L2 [Candidatus Peregrinibacteria bacterium]